MINKLGLDQGRRKNRTGQPLAKDLIISIMTAENP